MNGFSSLLKVQFGPEVFLHLFMIGTVIWLLVHLQKKMAPTALGKAYVLGALTSLIWACFEVFEIVFVQPKVRLFLIYAQSLGFAGAGPAWLYFMAHLIRHPIRKNRLFLSFLWLVYFLCLAMVLTNELHGLFYDPSGYKDGSFSAGGLLWVVVGIQYLLLLVGYTAALAFSLTSKSLRHSLEPFYLLLAGVIPGAGVMLREFGVVPIHLDGPAILLYTVLMFFVLQSRQPRLKAALSLSALLDNLDAALLGLTTEGRIVESNRRFLHIFDGRFKTDGKLPETVGEIVELLAPMEMEDDLSLVSEIGKVPIKKPIRTSLRLKPDGVHWAHLELHPLWAHGRLMGYLLQIQDVSQVSRLTKRLKDREEKLALANEELEAAHNELALRARELEDLVEAKAEQLASQQKQLLHSQKMESLGTLAGGIAHDFNNVLFSLIGYADLVLDSTDKPEEVSYCAAKIKEGAERAADLTSKLLGFARRVEPELKEIDLGELVTEVVTILQRTVEPRVGFYKSIPPGLPTALADENGLHQVLMNVCLNAVEAIKGAGRVTLSLEGPFEGSSLNINGAEEEMSYLLLQVKDDGEGMTEEVRARIFEPFYTTKSRGKGTGLGLSLVYGIIGDHGGLISVESKPKEGTVFFFYLRVFNQTSKVTEGKNRTGLSSGDALQGEDSSGQIEGASSGEGALSSNQGSAHQGSSIKRDLQSYRKPAKTFAGIRLRSNRLGILVIDDNSEVLNLCRRYFEEPLFTVWTALGAEEGCKILRENKDNIDVVLLDLIIPDASPEEAYNALHEVKPQITTIVISGHHGDKRVDRLLDMGAQQFLKKPFSRKDLRGAVRHLLEE